MSSQDKSTQGAVVTHSHTVSSHWLLPHREAGWKQSGRYRGVEYQRVWQRRLMETAALVIVFIGPAGLQGLQLEQLVGQVVPKCLPGTHKHESSNSLKGQSRAIQIGFFQLRRLKKALYSHEKFNFKQVFMPKFCPSPIFTLIGLSNQLKTGRKRVVNFFNIEIFSSKNIKTVHLLFLSAGKLC